MDAAKVSGRSGAFLTVLVAAALAGSPTTESTAEIVEPRLPVADHLCPTIREGYVEILGASAVVVVAGSPEWNGPVILYWHGTGADPLKELEHAFGERERHELRESGGLLVAFVDSTRNGATTSGNGVWHEGDWALADHLLACSVQQVGIDPTRIHVMGMSAGGLHAAAMAYHRAHYVASVITLSGGHLVYRGQDGTSADYSSSNRFAALVVHGGALDTHILDFGETSRAFAAALRSNGHDPVVCDHGQGHIIPKTVGPAAWRFFQDNSFGNARVYGNGGLPEEIEELCHPREDSVAARIQL